MPRLIVYLQTNYGNCKGRCKAIREVIESTYSEEQNLENDLIAWGWENGHRYDLNVNYRLPTEMMYVNVYSQVAVKTCMQRGLCRANSETKDPRGKPSYNIDQLVYYRNGALQTVKLFDEISISPDMSYESIDKTALKQTIMQIISEPQGQAVTEVTSEDDLKNANEHCVMRGPAKQGNKIRDLANYFGTLKFYEIYSPQFTEYELTCTNGEYKAVDKDS